MQGIEHPLTGELYEIDDDDPDCIRVTDADGRAGRFTPGGRHLSGDVRWADPHLCGWVMSSVMANRYVDTSSS